MVQHARVYPLRDKDGQGEEELVVHGPESGHDEQEYHEFQVFHNTEHIPEYIPEGASERSLLYDSPVGFLVEKKQHEVQRDNTSRYIEHEVGRSFEQKGDHRSEEGAYVNHHVVDAEPDGGCFIRCGLGNCGRDDRFEQGGTQSQVKVHEEYSRERGEHGQEDEGGRVDHESEGQYFFITVAISYGPGQDGQEVEYSRSHTHQDSFLTLREFQTTHVG